MEKAPLALIAALCAPALIAAAPRVPPMSAAELASYLPGGATVETLLNADINGDGLRDVVAVGRTDDKRVVRVMLAYVTQTDLGYRPVGEAEMDIDPLADATLSVERGVLLVKDLTGGTSALASTYRYRYDPAKDRMRLIGDDVSYYSRTNSHGSLDISTNRLTGVRIETRSRLNTGGGTAALLPGKPVRRTVSTRPVYMEDAPLPAETAGISA